MRSGWNGSKSSTFSPMPANLIGLPVTALRLRAAPPRASPSSLVRMEPVIWSAWSKRVATLTASWPVAASRTSKVSWGATRWRRRTNSWTSGSSICRRPAVSKMSVFRLLARAKSSASPRDFEHVGPALADIDGQPGLLAQLFQLVHGRRAIHVRGHQQRGAALLEEQPAQLAARGGLARAVQPHHQDATGIAAQFQTRIGRARAAPPVHRG